MLIESSLDIKVDAKQARPRRKGLLSFGMFAMPPAEDRWKFVQSRLVEMMANLKLVVGAKFSRRLLYRVAVVQLTHTPDRRSQESPAMRYLLVFLAKPSILFFHAEELEPSQIVMRCVMKII